jgi:hypothetical protein
MCDRGAGPTEMELARVSSVGCDRLMVDGLEAAALNDAARQAAHPMADFGVC